MTSTFTVVRDDVKYRSSTGSTSNEPSDAQVVLWVIRAFKTCIGIVPPVTETTASVSSSALTATVVADQVYFVSYKSDVLLPSEWSKQTTTLHFKPGSVDLGGTISYWRFNSLLGNGGALLSDTSTSADTTCIFGTDWLEEPATLLTLMNVLLRNSNVSPTGDGPSFMANYRVIEEERDKILKPYIDAWNRWYEMMANKQAARVSVGDLPLRESPGAGMVNRSRITNRLTGVP